MLLLKGGCRSSALVAFFADQFVVKSRFLSHYSCFVFRVRIFDQSLVNMYHNSVKNQKKAIVQSVKSKEKHKQKPQALNTVEMLRVASSALNIGPQQAMHVSPGSRCSF